MKAMNGQSVGGAVLGVTVLLALATSRTEANEHRLEISPRLLQDTTTVGIGFNQTPTNVSASVSAASTFSIEDELVETLERDHQVIVMSDVQLGELLCDSMTEAENATLLSFPISADEAVIAEKTSFSVLDGGGFSDGIARKVWRGKDVGGVIEGAHRTVSMTWGEECEVETFLLKITTNYDDGSLFVLKSVPCEAGSNDEICMVEVELYLKDAEEIEATTAGLHSSYAVRQLQDVISGARELQSTTTTARELQSTTTTIDVMLLYTETVNDIFGGVSDSQVMSTLATAIASSNQALTDSNIDAEFHLVYTGPLPYNETSTDIYEVLYAVRDNEAVAQLRSCTGADLVQLIGYFDDTCGLGFLFTGEPDAGFSVTSANCIEGFSHTHELGHNLGCFHNRENSKTDTEYAHGWRYCDGSDPYRTVMSYSNNCDVPRVHFFSNPGVMLYDKPTGQEHADNARVFELNMAIVADFESNPTDRSTCELPTPIPTPTLDLVDASERTEVTVSANAYDTRNSEESGCDPDGCVPSNTRDNTLIYDSRWSCIKRLQNETCRLTYKFDVAQDILEINIAFFKGNERTRTFEVETLDISGDTSTTQFTSSGETDGFETFYLGSVESTELIIFLVAPNEEDWISILEVEIMVQ